MREILYTEVPTPDTASVVAWLHQEWQPTIGKKVITPDANSPFSFGLYRELLI
jgi:lycopene cyclase CruA